MAACSASPVEGNRNRRILNERGAAAQFLTDGEKRPEIEKGARTPGRQGPPMRRRTAKPKPYPQKGLKIRRA